MFAYYGINRITALVKFTYNFYQSFFACTSQIDFHLQLIVFVNPARLIHAWDETHHNIILTILANIPKGLLSFFYTLSSKLTLRSILLHSQATL